MQTIVISAVLLVLTALSASAATCSGCHPLPEDRSHMAHLSLKIIKPAYGDVGITMNYVRDSDTYAFNCGNCHPADISKHGNGAVDIELSPSDAQGLKAMNSRNAGYSKEKKTCIGVYCHSSGGARAFLEYRETPAWGASFDEFKCQSCHGNPPSYRNQAGRENSHINAETPLAHLLGIHWDATRSHTKEALINKRSSNIGCSTCHYTTVAIDRDTTYVDGLSGLFTCSRCHDDRTIPGKNQTGIIANKSVHVNGIAEVSFRPEKFRTTASLARVPDGWTRTGGYRDPKGFDETVRELNSAAYIPAEKKCLNVACHLLGKEVRWGEAITCDSCHRDFADRK